MSKGNTGPGHEKPRRLEDDTADYLMQMEQELDKVSHQDSENRVILVENALQEIENRSASATCDRRTNAIVEKFCTEAGLECLLSCLVKWTPYVIFLARNRFASHIVQTTLARITYLMKDKPSIEEEFPSLVDTMSAFAAPLLNDVHWLSQEQCSSFVLRSLVCLLAGVPPIAEKKTKKAKHQHSISYALTLDEMLDSTSAFSIAHRFSIAVPLAFHTQLLDCIHGLTQRSPRDLQLLVAAVPSNAFLLLALRVLACSERFSDEQGPQLAHSLVHKVLELPTDDEDSTSPIESQVYFGMAGDRCGSYFLEGILAVLQPTIFIRLTRGSLLGSCEQFLRDPTSNFVLQGTLKRLERDLLLLSPSTSAESDEPASKKKKGSSQSSAETSPVVDVAVDLVNELLSLSPVEESILRLWRERNGVLLGLVQTARALAVVDASRYNDLSTSVIQLMLRTWGVTDVTGDNVAQSAAVHLSERFTALPEPAAPPAPEPRRPGSSGESAAAAAAAAAPKGPPDLSAQLLLARLLSSLITHPVPSVSTLAANIVIALSPAALQLIATTGNLSRSLLDVFLQHYTSGRAPSPHFVKQLSAALIACGVTLAGHFVGQHVVKKVYECCDLRGRERWAQILSTAPAMAALSRHKEGRGSLQLVQAEMYAKDAGEWRTAVKKQMKATDLFKDLLGEDGAAVQQQPQPAQPQKKSEAPKAKPQKQADNSDSEGDDDAGGEDSAGADGQGGKRKRKRKRAGKKTAGQS